MELKSRIRMVRGDITTLGVDAIVNAANSALLPGGGVDGAIRRTAGRQIDDDLYRIGRCPTGQAVITRGFRLPARHVIHTVAPIWNGDEAAQQELLSACYDNSLALADRHQIRTIAFPAIGTGAYGWPSDIAAKIAFGRAKTHLTGCTVQDYIIFCCFTDDDFAAYADLTATLE